MSYASSFDGYSILHIVLNVWRFSARGAIATVTIYELDWKYCAATFFQANLDKFLPQE